MQPLNDRSAAADSYDAIVIGSGFGGAMAAHTLVHAGWRVLLLERGGWVERGEHNWAETAVGPLTPHYSTESPYEVVGRNGSTTLGAFHCVGGPSVFYGGVSLRLRAQDFQPDPEVAGPSGAEWPIGYADLEPYYAEAERLLDVSGAQGVDPTEPPRTGPYPHPPGDLAPISRRIEAAARGLGLHPFRLPLAITRTARGGRGPCRACGTCDGFACAVGAKNDLAVAVIRPLLGRGLRLVTDAAVCRLHVRGTRVTGVEAVNRNTGRRTVFRGRQIVLAAGALASPHLLLASGLQRLNPGGQVIGRYLMRHYNEIVFGIFPQPPSRGGAFHKQLGIHDLYFGHPSVRHPRGKLGALQQLATPPIAMVWAELPWLVAATVAPMVKYLTGLLVMAEDQPCYTNRVLLDESRRDRYGLPRLVLNHRHTDRDRAAGTALAKIARAIFRRAGALGCYRHQIGTYSHAVGTVRMGTDPWSSALDGECRFRGVENLSVIDGSVLPTSGAVNPSLTIAAIALRAARALIRRTAQLSEPKHRVATHR
jgi:choline dehydrogenase-like flavoprotein